MIEPHGSRWARRRSRGAAGTTGRSTPEVRQRCERSDGQERLCVLVADMDGLVRGSVRAAFDGPGRAAKVVCATDGREAISLARYHRPAVVLLNTGMPWTDGIGALIGAVLQAAPACRVVTMAIDDDAGALAALRAGAIGHLDKDVEPGVLAREVARAAEGEAIVPRRLTGALLELARQLPETGWRPLNSCLTNREWEIVDLLCAGADTQTIADRLVLSTTTVYSHIKNMLGKLGVHCRADAVDAALALRREEALGGNLPNVVA